MARPVLTLALGALLVSPAAFAQPAASPAPMEVPPPHGDAASRRGPRDTDRRSPGDDRGMLDRFKKHLENMSPEERQRFQENWKRWGQMDDGERRDWQKRAMEEREHVRKCVDEAISGLGLKLDSDQREVFALRYHQERRKIEQKLCAEMDGKRKTMTDDMLQRLKAEFTPPKPAPTPVAPKPAPTPKQK